VSDSTNHKPPRLGESVETGKPASTTHKLPHNTRKCGSCGWAVPQSDVDKDDERNNAECSKCAATKRRAEIEDRIIAGLEQGELLVALCKREGIARSTFYRWLEDNPSLPGRFARARDLGFDVIAEQTFEIADTPSASKIEATDKRIRIDARVKLLEKWDRKRYGSHTTIAGDPDAPLQVSVQGIDHAETLVAMLAVALARKQRAEREGLTGPLTGDQFDRLVTLHPTPPPIPMSTCRPEGWRPSIALTEQPDASDDLA